MASLALNTVSETPMSVPKQARGGMHVPQAAEVALHAAREAMSWMVIGRGKRA